MAKLSRDKLIEELKAYTGDRTDEETLKLIEDVSDTTEPEEAEPSEDWEGKYNDLAKKYKDRFSGASEEVKEEPKKETEESDTEDLQIDDLFEDEKED